MTFDTINAVILCFGIEINLDCREYLLLHLYRKLLLILADENANN